MLYGRRARSREGVDLGAEEAAVGGERRVESERRPRVEGERRPRVEGKRRVEGEGEMMVESFAPPARPAAERREDPDAIETIGVVEAFAPVRGDGMVGATGGGGGR